MDTNSLYYFAEAAKDMNFTKTAKRLFISQQNLSNHIMRLELTMTQSCLNVSPTSPLPIPERYC